MTIKRRVLIGRFKRQFNLITKYVLGPNINIFSIFKYSPGNPEQLWVHSEKCIFRVISEMSRSHIPVQNIDWQRFQNIHETPELHFRNAGVAFKNNPKTTSLQTSQSNILKWTKRGSPYEPLVIFGNSKRARLPKFNFTTILSNKRTTKMDVGTKVFPFGKNSTKRQFLVENLEIWQIQQTKLETVKSLRSETVSVDLSYWMLFEFWLFAMEFFGLDVILDDWTRILA